MANNIAILDGASASQTTKTTDTAGVHVPHVNVDTIAAGTNAIGKLAANSGVDIGDVDVTSVIPGTGATNLGKAIDTAAGATDTGVAVLAVRDDALTTLTPVDGDYVPLRVGSTGALHVTATAGAADIVDDAAFTPGTTGVVMVGFEADEGSTDSVDEGDGGAARMTLDRKQIVTEQPHTSGGLSYATIVSAATNNETDIKTAAGKVYFLSVQSIDATPVYIKFFNATAANVTMGTTAAAYQFMCPAAATAANGAGIVLTFPTGIEHTTAITVAITTGIALTDNTSTSANEVVLTIGYK